MDAYCLLGGGIVCLVLQAANGWPTDDPVLATHCAGMEFTAATCLRGAVICGGGRDCFLWSGAANNDTASSIRRSRVDRLGQCSADLRKGEAKIMSALEVIELGDKLKKTLSDTSDQLMAARVATRAGLLGVIGSAAISGAAAFLPLVGPLVAVSAALAGAGYLKKEYDDRVRPKEVHKILDDLVEHLDRSLSSERKSLLRALLASLLVNSPATTDELANLTAAFAARRAAAREVRQDLTMLSQCGIVIESSEHKWKYTHDLVAEYFRRRLDVAEKLSSQKTESKPEPTPGA